MKLLPSTEILIKYTFSQEIQFLRDHENELSYTEEMLVQDVNNIMKECHGLIIKSELSIELRHALLNCIRFNVRDKGAGTRREQNPNRNNYMFGLRQLIGNYLGTGLPKYVDPIIAIYKSATMDS